MSHGAELRAWREGKGWSQQALADRLGLTRAMVSLMESGARAIQPRTAVVLRLVGFPPKARAKGARAPGRREQEPA